MARALHDLFACEYLVRVCVLLFCNLLLNEISGSDCSRALLEFMFRISCDKETYILHTYYLIWYFIVYYE